MLVVAPDVSVLHEIAWMLDAVGYDVHTSTDLDQAALWRRYSLADVVTFGVAPAFANDQWQTTQVGCDQVEVPGNLLGDVVNRARDLDDQEQVRPLGYEIE